MYRKIVIILQHKFYKLLIMKKAKKSTESFQVLNTVQMDKIKGGQWVEVTNPDGTKTLIWV
jgi:hypothetical protein